jgi:starvation-inducible outer membrane lipoprotein
MRLFLCALTLCLAGCVTKPRKERPDETEEQRIHRDVFYTDWVRPSVSQEDVDFFYDPFWKTR